MGSCGRALLVIISSALLLASDAASQTQAVDWTGTWNTKTGAGNAYVFKLKQSGSTVTGTVTKVGQGTVSKISNGTASGRKLTFNIVVGADTYKYEFTMSANGNAFTGRWGYGTDAAGVYAGGTWSGQRAVATTPTKRHYRMLIWTDTPDGVSRSTATTIPRGTGHNFPDAFVRLRWPGAPFRAPYPVYDLWWEQTTPSVGFSNASLTAAGLDTCRGRQNAHCLLNGIPHKSLLNSLQGLAVGPGPGPVPVTRIYRVTARDNSGRILIISNHLRITWVPS